eukprot:CAMPEP_0184345978 /NCGR_PEP_ID=MMETSP1089-20130417/14309_1 /TAXON_ID=38269 ORGANISM="Gloeochaete wittrockiana, Strain SAG46.84" /NCGR_SAMPLE_ID=MMETSP1089 /ASSEMBLY_ACC=CAM_ASM_000445 /LENGTH=309 /DNA_ID=CAMNT_0026676481 /DNA_START=34 /DNA_END=960 /DNA_ORIENTATION=-
MEDAEPTPTTTTEKFIVADKYEQISQKSDGIFNIDSQEAFDGLKFEVTRNVANNFQLAHSFSLATSEEPASYSLSAAFVSNNLLLTSRIFHDGRLMGRIKYVRPSQRIEASTQLIAGSTKAAFVPQIEVSKQINKATFVAQYTDQQQQKAVGLAATYSPVKTIVVGSSLVHMFGKSSTLSFATRFLKNGANFCIQTFGLSSIQLSVARTLGRHTVATQFGFMFGKKEEQEAEEGDDAPPPPIAPGTGSIFQRFAMQSVAQVGVESRLPFGSFRGTLDSSGRVNALFEDLTPASFSLFGSYNCLDGSFRT